MVWKTPAVPDLGRLADENLASTWARVARRCGAVGRVGPLQLAATGLPIAFFNGAYLTARTTEPGSTIDAAQRFMAAQGVPWLLWVRDGVDDALLDAGRRAGLTDAGGPPAMALHPLTPPPAPPAGLSVRVVADEAGIDDHIDLARRSFDMPEEIARTMVNAGTVADPDMVILVGDVEGTPVSTAILSVTGPTAGLYTVATPPGQRGRGYGAALSWAAVEAGRRRGCDHAVLQASPDGYPVYRSMGFVDVGVYRQLESAADAER